MNYIAARWREKVRRALRLPIKFLYPLGIANFRLLSGVLSPKGRFLFIQFVARILAARSRLRGNSYLNQIYMDGHRSTAFAHAIRFFYRRNIAFEVSGKQVGFKQLPKTGGILVSGHFHLNYAFLRMANDLGYSVSVVRAGQKLYENLMGCNTPMDQLDADKKVFFKIKDRIAAGHLVVVMVDTIAEMKESEIWWTLQTPYGRRSVSMAAMRFAESINTELFFTATYVNSNFEIESHVVKPASSTIQDLRLEFEQFLRKTMGDIA